MPFNFWFVRTPPGGHIDGISGDCDVNKETKTKWFNVPLWLRCPTLPHMYVCGNGHVCSSLQQSGRTRKICLMKSGHRRILFRTGDTDAVVLAISLTHGMYEVKVTNCIPRPGICTAEDSFETLERFFVLLYDRTCTYSKINPTGNPAKECFQYFLSWNSK